MVVGTRTRLLRSGYGNRNEFVLNRLTLEISPARFPIEVNSCLVGVQLAALSSREG